MAIALHRPDGAVWQTLQKGNIDVLLTSKGRELLVSDPVVEARVCTYLERALGVTATQGDGVRWFFEKDSNGRIYTLDHASYGNNLLVKETSGHSMEQALDRLDRIKAIIDKRRNSGLMPGFIDVPDHYGVVSGPELPHQYVLMQGIDHGINVRDVIYFDQLNAKERLGVTSVLGPVTDAMQDEVLSGYERTEDILKNAIAEETYREPTHLISDWHPGNVVLEQLDAPVDDSNWKYWVIDQ